MRLLDFRRRQKGLTLIELLIVIAIIAILILLSWVSWRQQIDKANDADRKEDLDRLKTSFEEYFNDNEAYPPQDILDNCGGNEMSPYLSSIPCDPTTNQPYCYVVDPANPYGFRILVPLQNNSDVDIAELGCDGTNYCGFEEECSDLGEGFNYGVSSSNISVANPDMPPEASPSPSPSGSGLPTPGDYGCDPNGVCNIYADPETAGCPITFEQPNVCQEYCDDSSDYWCDQ